MDCPICYEPIGQKYYVTKCGHAFHQDCLESWYKHKKTCPYCRTPQYKRDKPELIRSPKLPKLPDLDSFVITAVNYNIMRISGGSLGFPVL
jgi:hypothetical protein